jgi:NTP pyrophosphatase (non-canonical NTP hydrolase)
MKLLSDTLKTWVKEQEAGIWQGLKKERGQAVHLLAYTAKLGEEVGELSEQILGRFGYQRKSKHLTQGDDELADECADVIIVTLFLAQAAGIDIEKALKRKMEKLEVRNKEI